MFNYKKSYNQLSEQSIMKLFLLLAAFITVALGANLRITEGNGAYRNQFPYQVYISQVGTTSTFKGGVIIGPRWILTGADGISGYNPSQLQVNIGILNRNDTGIENQQTIYADEIIPHPNYDVHTGNYDICIIRLSSLLTYGDNVQSIPLIPANATEPYGRATIIGWGLTLASSTEKPERLQYADVQILNATECVASIIAGNHNEYIYNSTIKLCTTGHFNQSETSACSGDDGGPLVYNDYLIGIVSWFDILKCANPTIYTKISAVRQWILNNTNGEIE